MTKPLRTRAAVAGLVIGLTLSLDVHWTAGDTGVAGQGQAPGGTTATVTPTMPIAGPQGIGLRIEPVSPDAPRFEAVSIRRDPSGVMPPSSQGQLVSVKGNRLFAPNITIRELIRNGYNLQHVPRSFVVEGPDWIDSERYNVDAVAAEPFMSQQVRNVPPPDAATMIRSMLADRFGLKARNELREMRVYELVLDRPDGRLGPGLTPSSATCLGPFDLVDLDTTNRSIVATPDGKPFFCPFGYGYGPTSRMMASNMRMRDIAMFFGLIASVNMGVIDRTGVEGRFDINLTFAGDVELSPTAAPRPREVGATEVPTLPGAIRDQLGLRIQPTRALVEVLVVDDVERPSDN